MAGSGSRHVTENPVGSTADSIADPGQHVIIHHVTDKDISIDDDFGFQQINSHQTGRPLAQFGAHRCHLHPAAGGASKVDNGHPRLEQFVAIINLFELKCSARTKSTGFSLGNKGVIQLAGQPALR